MTREEKLLKRVILKWIGKSYGSQEMEDPCYDINALVKEISKHSYELYHMVEADNERDSVAWVAKTYLNRELTESQLTRAVEEYVMSEGFHAMTDDEIETIKMAIEIALSKGE